MARPTCATSAHRYATSTSWPAGLFAIGSVVAGLPAAALGQEAPDGRALYEATCALCHGVDGTGQNTVTELEVERPDFSQCWFASREPDADWMGVAIEGGPSRGFSELMPPWEETLNRDQLLAVLAHIRTFCTNDSWPRGELNLPRALYTEKAFPEDELVLTTDIELDDGGTVGNELVYERRFGARHQLEVVVPFAVRDVTDVDGDLVAESREAGVGDLALGWKTAVAHSLESGAIFSLGGEVILPTGDDEEGFGKGTTVFEPYLAFGQILPGDGFLHAQAGAELSTDTSDAPHALFWRAVLGRTFTQGEFGRAWSPMLELLGEAETGVEDRETHWDLVPQLQVTLNKRQHVMLNAGVRIPLDDASERDTRLVIYLLWDWFDGGLLSGW